MLDSLNIAKHSYHRTFLYLMQTPSCHNIALYYCSDTKDNIQILYAGVHQCDKYACMCMYKINRPNYLPLPTEIFLAHS